MDYIDYRTQLGVGFSDEEKQKHFINRIKNFILSSEKIAFERDKENAFADAIGESSIIEENSIKLYQLDWESPTGLQRAWLYLEKKSNDFPDFMATTVILANIYKKEKQYYMNIWENIKRSLLSSHISYEVVSDYDGDFLLPKGAKELDDALISEPLEWLKDYQKTRKSFGRALKQYANGDYIRDVADNFRKTLEEFLQEFLQNDKNLESNRHEIGKHLKEKGADNNIINMLEPLLASYKKINDYQIKHNDKLDPKFLEFLMYQTGLFIRMIIIVGKED